MSSFGVKILACVFMLIDHIGFYFFPSNTILRCIGRISMPLFAFQISIGYSHTRNKKNYLLKLLLFAFISQLPFQLFRETAGYTDFRVNIFFSLFISALCLYIIDLYHEKKKEWILLFNVPLIVAAYLLKVDYSFYCPLLVITFYLFTSHEKGQFSLLILCFILSTCLYVSYLQKNPIQYFAILALIPITLFNGEKGINAKYFFYFFYPLHLLLLIGFKYFLP